eukprot:9811617-Alexandrium_andersonii.AAC.1
MQVRAVRKDLTSRWVALGVHRNLLAPLQTSCLLFATTLGHAKGGAQDILEARRRGALSGQVQH